MKVKFQCPIPETQSDDTEVVHVITEDGRRGFIVYRFDKKPKRRRKNTS